MTCVDKILGADVELGNVFEHRGPAAISNDGAARLVLAEIDGVAGSKAAASTGYGLAGPAVHGYPGEDPLPAAGYGADPQDWGRRFLVSSGGCFYIDLGHLEACIPEVRSARDFVAAHHANLRLARAACAKANERLVPDGRIVMMANNSDRLGQSWGGHLNVLVSRELWTRLFDRMYPSLFVLAAFQVSSIIYTGQGKVGAENGKDRVDFQISQRGDFFECLAGVQTTCRRPIVNTRDEAHVGAGASASELARLHVIFHDTTLTHVSNYLKAGVTQIVLSMLESGWCDARVVLDDPLAALTAWGHDPELRAVARLADGRAVTAVEHQQMIVGAARRFVETGQAGHVPDAGRILALWEDTLARLACRDFEPLARRLDWILKRALLQRLLDRDSRLDWHASAIRAADLRFASLDPAEGLYWLVEAGGGTEQIVTDDEIRHAMCEPPADTRAWARTYLLRQFARDGIEAVNWDEIRLAAGTPAVAPKVIRLDDPRRFTRAETLGNSEPASGGSEAALPAQSPDQRKRG